MKSENIDFLAVSVNGIFIYHSSILIYVVDLFAIVSPHSLGILSAAHDMEVKYNVFAKNPKSGSTPRDF